MSNALTQYQTQPVGQPQGTISNLEEFMQRLNQEPEPHEVDINKAAKNSKYIPISYIQMKLDKIFMGLWETVDFRYTVVVNEICGVVTLRCFHPVSRTWITREGSAAVMIMQAKDSAISDVNAKIKNTLQKDLPHLLAACTSSAAKTLGKAFGRDLNRKEELTDDYNRYYTDMAAAEVASESIAWEDIKTIEHLKAVWNDNEDLHENKDFKKKFTYAKNKINRA